MAPVLLNENGVRLYIRSNEHLPPHIHAESGDDDAMIDIRTGELIRGEMESRSLKYIQKWLGEGRNRKRVEEEFYRLNPSLKPGGRFKSDNRKK